MPGPAKLGRWQTRQARLNRLRMAVQFMRDEEKTRSQPAIPPSGRVSPSPAEQFLRTGESPSGFDLLSNIEEIQRFRREGLPGGYSPTSQPGPRGLDLFKSVLPEAVPRAIEENIPVFGPSAAN